MPPVAIQFYVEYKAFIFMCHRLTVHTFIDVEIIIHVVQVKLRLRNHYVIKVYRDRRGKSPWIQGLWTTCSKGECSSSGHCLRGKCPRYPLERRLGGPQSQSERGGGEERNPVYHVFWNWGINTNTYLRAENYNSVCCFVWVWNLVSRTNGRRVLFENRVLRRIFGPRREEVNRRLEKTA